MEYNQQTHSQALPEGYRVGDYILDRVFRLGGFGITYFAHDRNNGAQVIVKENMPRKFAFRDTATQQVKPLETSHGQEGYKWALGNFYNEVQMLGNLDHPNIVKVFHAFQALGTAYYVMPYVGGSSLDMWAEQHGKPDCDTVLHLLSALLSALGYLHANNILHSAIKPKNILMTPEGEPVLTNFFSACKMIGGRTQTQVGSPGYTPFEQMQRHGKCGPWSDCYALGATMYRILTGKTPMDCRDRMGDDEDDPLVPLATQPELVARYGKPLLAGIDVAMSLKISRRWQSAEEWRKSLGAPPAERRAPAEHRFPGSPEQPGWTAMHAAALAGRTEVVKHMLERGADINAKDKDGAPPLHYAGTVETAKLLLDRGADIHAENIYGDTPLHYAKTAEIARLLLERGADMRAKNKYGEPPIFRAALNGCTIMVEFWLNRGAGVKVRNGTNETPLHEAAKNSAPSTAKLLLDRGADVYAVDKYGRTPLHEAAWWGRTETAKLLLERGADINAEDDFGRTPLADAEERGETATANFLRSRGARK